MRFTHYKQLDSMDYGPSCLRMVAKFYGKNYTLQALRSKSFVTKSGVSMLGISDAAESIGFRTRGYRLSCEQLLDDVPLLCIVHWNQRHFVVVYKIKGRASRASHASRASRKRLKGKQDLQDLQDQYDLHDLQDLHYLQDSKYIVHVADPASGLLKYVERGRVTL